ncbi:MAG TPA: cadmium-translocating P-type ATPase [Clostridiales bacterium]|nr:cadmium-translocating P-type ATPase [Clostridiales bacterium]
MEEHHEHLHEHCEEHHEHCHEHHHDHDECCDDGLDCGCESCREKSAKRKEKGEGFFAEYGAEIIKILLSAIVLILAVTLPVGETVQLIMCIASLIICGYEVIINCFKNIFKGNIFDENFLMTLASVVALCIGERFEGALIVILYSFGELLEDIATDSSRKRIAGLSELKSDSVRVILSSGVTEVSPEEVEVGTLIEIRKGDRVPLDGVLVGADAEFDLKAVTGESKPYHVKDGESVYAGAINIGAPVVMRTTKKYEDSTVARIISLVEGANAKKAKTQKFITTFSKYYTPTVVGIAVLLAFVPPLFDSMNFVKWILKALNFLVISCPCALVISVPLGFFVGIGSLSKKGVLVKGSNYIDVLSAVNVTVFDKTGTLTKGNFKVEKIVAENGFTEDDIKNSVAPIESSSSHPIAKSITEYCAGFKTSAINVEEIAGKGMKGNVNGKTVYVGNAALMADLGLTVSDGGYSGTVIYVAENSKFAGKILIYDEIKETSVEAIKLLKKYGVKKTVMISGDNAQVCRAVGEKVGIDEVYSGLLPDQKADKLSEIIASANGKVLYAGDGINDAPSLAMADVGVAMGGLGSESAIESADVVVMDDNALKIPLSIKYSRRIRRKVKENIIGSLAIKFAIMVLSVVFTLPIWVAMIADVGVMLLAVANSLTNYIIK